MTTENGFVGGVDHGEMSIKILTALDYQPAKLRESLSNTLLRLLSFTWN